MRNLPRSRRDFYFSIDLRSLGLFRLLLAAVLISDWWVRWPNLRAFYTAEGFLPGDALLAAAGGDFRFNFLAGVTSLGAVRVVFLAGLVCYVLFLVGLRTRVFHAASFLFFLTVLQRNDLISHGGDNILLVLCMWSLFLPLGSRFSVDALIRALRRSAARGPQAIRAPLPAEELSSAPSLAALVIVLQIGLVYFLTAVVKQGQTWREGTAVYYALHLDHFATPVGSWLREQPLAVLRFLAWGTLGLEFAALPLLLLPWGQPWLRRVAILALTTMHVSFSLTMTIGTFSAAMITSFALLLSRRDWTAIERWLLRPARAVTAYYDDACGLCLRCCRLLAVADRAGNIRFVGSSDKAAFEDNVQQKELDTSLVVVERATRAQFRRAEAVAAAFRALPLPFHVFRLLAVPGIAVLTGAAYDLVARNRRRLSLWLGEPACTTAPAGGSGAPRTAAAANLPASAPAARFLHRGQRVLAGICVALLLAAALVDGWNLSIARRFGLHTLPDPPWRAHLVQSLLLPRGWYMFAPDPWKYDGWWVIDAQTYDGGRIDPLTDAPPAWAKPRHAEKRYDVFWRMYLHKLCLPEYSQYRAWFGWYVTRKNRREKTGGGYLQSFDFWYVREVTQPPGTPSPFPTERILLWRYDCKRGRVLPQDS